MNLFGQVCRPIIHWLSITAILFNQQNWTLVTIRKLQKDMKAIINKNKKGRERS